MPTPALTIDDFKAAFQGGARQYLFYFIPTFPATLNVSPEKVTYLVRSTTAPTNTIEEIPVNWQGYDFKVAGRNTFGDLTVSFNVDKNAEIIEIFYNWMKQAHDPETNAHAENLSNYMTNQELQMIGLNGTTIFKYTLYHAWVKDVAGVGMDYGSNDISQFDVTWAYAWHKAEKVSMTNT